MLDGFKKFIMRGNMVDMAVGVVMGAAVTTIVTALVDGFINPLVTAIFGKQDMSNLWVFTINNSQFKIGSILGAVINFLIISVAVYFCIVVPINKMRDVTEKAMAAHRKGGEDVAAEEPDLSAEEQTVILLQQIRDSLAKQNEAAEAEAHNGKHSAA